MNSFVNNELLCIIFALLVPVIKRLETLQIHSIIDFFLHPSIIFPVF